MAPDFSVVGRALATPARAAMVELLMDGTRRPASELAAYAGVRPSTASEHLAMLEDAGLVRCETSGRHRFYQLADASVAAALEQLGHLSPPRRPTSYHRTREARELAHARLCYDHLAGRLGVELTAVMVTNAWLDAELTLTQKGSGEFADLGIRTTAVVGSRRPVTRRCADWTERRPHLAGALGAAIATHFLEHDWVRRRRTGRGLDITSHGADAMREHWGFTPQDE